MFEWIKKIKSLYFLFSLNRITTIMPTHSNILTPTFSFPFHLHRIIKDKKHSTHFTQFHMSCWYAWYEFIIIWAHLWFKFKSCDYMKCTYRIIHTCVLSVTSCFVCVKSVLQTQWVYGFRVQWNIYKYIEFTSRRVWNCNNFWWWWWWWA